MNWNSDSSHSQMPLESKQNLNDIVIKNARQGGVLVLNVYLLSKALLFWESYEEGGDEVGEMHKFLALWGLHSSEGDNAFLICY